MSPKPHTRSWYADTATPHPAHPELAGEATCDVCVVGGGYTGLTSALHLAEQGYSVVLLEAERIGWGASGRNGGQIVSGFNPSQATIESWVGAGDARKLWDMAEEAKSLVRGHITHHNIACDLRAGYLFLALKPRHLGDLNDHLAEWRERCGYDEARLLDREQVREHVQSDAYLGGLLDRGGGHLHPLNYALGLADAAQAAGVRIYEGSRVVRLDTGRMPVAHTRHGSVTARFLVLAGNAYLGGLVPQLAGAFMPVSTYMLATEPLGERRAKALLPTDVAAADINFVLNYFRRTSDHRLLFGGGVSYSGLDRPGLKRALRKTMLAYFPQLADVAIDYCWGGHVAITMNRVPHFGRLGPATFFAHGFSGHGVGLTAIAGKLIAEVVQGTAERFDVFARIPHQRFPGGPLLRTPSLMAAMLWYRLRDLL
ncbi:MAG TPA: FAD-binding oxidoreductase [Azospirillaceae bacterium]|nr:FAD-binding oxidoreductase [Azospirillaceae bacterium]